MRTFKELISGLRRYPNRMLRYEEIMEASTEEATEFRTKWKDLVKQGRDNPVGFREVEKRMYRMLPERYHDRIKKPRKPTRLFLRKIKAGLRLERKRLNAIVSRFSTRTEVVDDFDDQALKIARERAVEQRTARNKETRKLNIVQYREAKKLRWAKNIIFTAAASQSRRRRKLAPLVAALIAKPTPVPKLSRATERKVEEITGHRVFGTRSKEMKEEITKKKKKKSLARWQRDEIQLFRKINRRVRQRARRRYNRRRAK